ncbi:hypothetical protein SLS53_000365 [Cytospora paraplurivora]|uniref:Uncharacterized protein n=1 Tax=Cytospora paraplurivora TaxID=2898453 RepID=A0AAN9UL44_9PEZI
MSLIGATRSGKIISTHDTAELIQRGLLRPLHHTQRIHLTLLNYEDISGLHPQAQPETSWLQVPVYLVSPETLTHVGRLVQAGDTTSAHARDCVEIDEFGMFITTTFDRSSFDGRPLVPRGDDDQDLIGFLQEELKVNYEIIQQIMDKESRECM